MTDIRFIYVTAPNMTEARKLAQKIVEDRLAACANIFPEMESMYWWEGKLKTATEAVILFKTRADKVEDAMALIRHWHSYSTPCILSFPIEKGDAPYLEWLSGEVRR
ncbi:MAG: divalent-cation tolerance protein CutA [Bdellovibrionaceae bacterium]|nr:divalent-cation tolerance protein CutA [Pseudobdellovibrionaceae bacterium]